jgi:NADPH2:quinone reductase
MRHTQIIVTHYGGLDTFQLLEEERPEPERGEVRVRVLAADVSLPDLMMCEGVHPETPRVPFTPGWDLGGEWIRSAMASLESNQGRQWPWPRCR